MTEDAHSRSGSDVPAVRVFPPFVPLSAVVAGILTQRLLPIRTDDLLPTPVRYWLGGLVIVGAVIFLGYRSIAMMRRSGQSEIPWTPVTRLLEDGPYRFTRNPMYLQLVLLCIGFGILLANAWIIIFTPLVVWALQRWGIVPEEEYLERQFGEEYREYKRRVRRWL
jgi:protein-S-isoprenylcysteine O-methyltransferase Ste14